MLHKSQQFMASVGLACIMVLTLSVLYQGVTPSFSSDDYVHLERNTHYASFTEALAVFTQYDGREYRPLVRLSLWLNHQMSSSAYAFKLTNLFLHIACVLLLYGLLRRLSFTLGARWVGTLIFAVHPVHTTSIHFIMGRTDLIAALMVLGCVLSVAYWQQVPKWRQVVISAVFFVGGLLSKELAITLPAVLVVLRAYQHPARPFAWLRRELPWLCLFGFLGIGYLVARWWMWWNMSDAISVYTDFSLPNVVRNYLEWGFALVYPFDLYIAWQWYLLYPVVFIVASALALVCSLGLLRLFYPGRLSAVMHSPALGLGIAWVLITLMPMMGGNAHRWYLYLPSVGVGIMAAAAWQLVPEGRRAAAGAFLFVLIGLYSVETANQSSIWQRQGAIAEQVLEEFYRLGAVDQDEIYVINVPFGYKGAFLFTHDALEKAMHIHFGRAPRMHPISFLNMDAENSLNITSTDSGLTISLTPNAHRYIMLSADERRFSQPFMRESEGVLLAVDKLNAAGRIIRYHLKMDLPPGSLYVFDGEHVLPLSAY